MSAGAHLNRVQWGYRQQVVAGRSNEDGYARQKDDFYATPPRGTEELLKVEQFDGPIWEPACGDGAISNALADAGYDVVSSDLVDRGFGETGIDFLMEWQSRAPNIVTNPPFKLSVPFVQKSLALTTRKVAMLLKVAFLEGQERGTMFSESPLARVWVFSQRLSFPKTGRTLDGSGMMAFAWFVWDHAHKGRPQLGWLPDRHYDPAENSRRSYDVAVAACRARLLAERGEGGA